MGEGGKKKETQQERERGRKKKWLPFYAFDFQAVREHPPIASRQAGWQAGRQKILKQSGVVGTFPLPLRFPLKFANTRVKCEFIRRSLTARGFSSRGSNSIQRREPFAASAKWKNGFSFSLGEERRRLRAARGISIAPSLKYKHNSIGPYTRLHPPISNTNPFLRSVQRPFLFRHLRPLPPSLPLPLSPSLFLRFHFPSHRIASKKF